MIRLLGYFAGTLTVVSFLPQVIRAWKSRQTRDLSMGMYTILITASSLWTIYGFIIHDRAVILTNVLMVALNLAIVTAKVRFG
ncbi:MAG TPA: SemiSWEET transporter [Gemmatimonadaceae bacterium]|jgi:MtN3 and saliva related transmembrane protein